MAFSNLLLSVAAVGTTTLALAIAAPASAQEHYAHNHYHHYVYHHHYAYHHPGRQIVVHAQEPVVVQPAYTWGPVAAVGTLVGGTGQAVAGLLPAPARLWAVSWAECLAARRRSSAPRRPTHMALRLQRRSMRPGQWPGAVPGGGRRLRRAAIRARPRRLLSQFRLYLSG